MEAAVVVPVGLAIASALAFLAYNHKLFYQKMLIGLELAILVTFIGLSAYDAGQTDGWSQAWKQALEAVPVEDGKPIVAMKQPDGLPIGWLSISLFLLNAYLMLLAYLPSPRDKTQ